MRAQFEDGKIGEAIILFASYLMVEIVLKDPNVIGVVPICSRVIARQTSVVNRAHQHPRPDSQSTQCELEGFPRPPLTAFYESEFRRVRSRAGGGCK